MNRNLIAYCGVDCIVCSDYTCDKCPGCKQTGSRKEIRAFPISAAEKSRFPSVVSGRHSLARIWQSSTGNPRLMNWHICE